MGAVVKAPPFGHNSLSDFAAKFERGPVKMTETTSKNTLDKNNQHSKIQLEKEGRAAHSSYKFRYISFILQLV